MFPIKPSPSLTQEFAEKSLETSVSEQIDRRSPFAQSEFKLEVETAAGQFDIEYEFLQPSEGDVIYAIVINSEAPLTIYKDPATIQPPGILRLVGSAATNADFLLFIKRP
jgi:hypothetical protein